MKTPVTKCGTAGRFARAISLAMILSAVLCYGRPAPQAGSLDGYSQQLLGIWESEDKIDGHPRVTCEIRVEDGRPAGTLSIRDSAAPMGNAPFPIRNVQFELAELSFKTDVPQQGTKEWVLRLMTSEKGLFCAVDNYAEVPKWMLQRR